MGNLEGWESVIESSEKDELGNPNLIELYRKINIVLDSITDEFEVTGSGIGIDEIDFGIVVKSGKKLPQKIAMLFFNLGPDYDMQMTQDNETYKHRNEHYFRFDIKNK